MRQGRALDAPLLQRLSERSRENRLAIAVGSGLSDSCIAIPALAEGLIQDLGLSSVGSGGEDWFRVWNSLVANALEKVPAEKLQRRVWRRARKLKPSRIHQAIACIPISNYLDCTFDRSLCAALTEQQRYPRLHDWDTQLMGSWKQSDPAHPEVFVSFPAIDGSNAGYGIFEPVAWQVNLKIHMSNIGDMLNGKDLVLLGFGMQEVRSILHIEEIAADCDKVVALEPRQAESQFWSTVGVCIPRFSIQEFVEALLPARRGDYGIWDEPLMLLKWTEILRQKRFDCFISYFSGDQGFVRQLVRQLRRRGIRTWLDASEIGVGDSITSKLEEGLEDSYSFVLVLTPEALTRKWVREELRAAYVKRVDEDYKIFPVLHKECEVPPLLRDYKYADFREEPRFEEEVALLARAIETASRQGQGKA